MEVGTEKIGFTPWWTIIVTQWEKLSGKAAEFSQKLKKLAMDDPRRIIHSFKVGLALTLVSIFYYVNALFNGFGTSTMWAVLTVVVVMEYTVGATLSKGLNRAFATLVAGALGLAAHYVAVLSGDRGEPILLGIFVFLLASAATFSRFIPEVKAKYDYGVIIFILTFSLVTVSSYRVEQVIEVAHQRLSTIAIGVAICLCTSALVFPVWAGDDLHNLVATNLEKLASFLEGLGVEYYGEDGPCEDWADKAFFKGYKGVLTSKTQEDNLANFVRWEPGHGSFKFRHPWAHYLKIGALSRQCAYYVEALTTLIVAAASVAPPKSADSSTAATVTPELINSISAEMSKECGLALRELSTCMRSMQASPYSLSAQAHVTAASAAAERLKAVVSAGNGSGEAIGTEILHAATAAALLVEVVRCSVEVVAVVEELARLAEFKSHENTSSAAANAAKVEENVVVITVKD